MVKTLFTSLGTSCPILKQGTLYTDPSCNAQFSLKITVIKNGILLIDETTGEIKASNSLRWKVLEPLTCHNSFAGSLFGFQISGPKSNIKLYCNKFSDFAEWWDVLAPQMFITEYDSHY